MFQILERSIAKRQQQKGDKTRTEEPSVSATPPASTTLKTPQQIYRSKIRTIFAKTIDNGRRNMSNTKATASLRENVSESFLPSKTEYEDNFSMLSLDSILVGKLFQY